MADQDINTAPPTPVPAQPLSGKTMPMFSPDGQVGDVPVERVPDAVKSGFKLGQDMYSPAVMGKPSSAGTIPIDRVHDALAAGFTLKSTEEPESDTGYGEGTGTAGQGGPVVTAGAHAMIGVVKGAAETAHTAGYLANAVPNALGAPIPGLPQSNAVPDFLKTHGFWEGLGAVGETAAEWLYGEGEIKAGIKGLASADDLGKIAKFAKTLEESPRLYGAIRSSLLGGTQAYAHGATLGQAATTGAITGGLVGGLTLGANATDIGVNWMKQGLNQLIENNKASNPVAASTFKEFKTLLDSTLGGKRLEDINKEIVGGILKGSQNNPAINAIGNSLWDVTKKFGTSAVKGLVSAYVTDLALSHTSIDPTLRHYIDATIGIGAYLKGPTAAQVFNSPEAIEFRSQLAGFVYRNPELLQSIKSGVASVLAQSTAGVVKSAQPQQQPQPTHQYNDTNHTAEPMEPEFPIAP